MKYGTMTELKVQGKILMIRKVVRENDPNSGLYTLPGGKLIDSERGLNQFGRLESAIRETKEETGLTLINPRVVGAILFNNFERKFTNWKNPEDFLVYMLTAEDYTGRLKKRTNEGTPIWVNEKDVEGLPKNIGDEKMYWWLKSGRFFIGNIKHKGRTLDKSGTFVDYLD